MLIAQTIYLQGQILEQDGEQNVRRKSGSVLARRLRGLDQNRWMLQLQRDDQPSLPIKPANGKFHVNEEHMSV